MDLEEIIAVGKRKTTLDGTRVHNIAVSSRGLGVERIRANPGVKRDILVVMVRE